MSVLKDFFRIAMLLTIMTIAINIFIVNFGEGLTGQAIPIPESCATTSTSFNGASSIKQTDTGQITSTQAEPNFGCTLDEASNYVTGLSKIINMIFVNIDPAEGDVIESFGTVLIIIITIMQVFGAAYLPWAMISAFLGGGAP